MASRDVNRRSEIVDWFSLEVVAERNSVEPNRYEKLLGLVPSFQAAGRESMENTMFFNRQPYVDDDMSDLMEEDVWGQDDEMSLFDGSTTPSSRPWPDSESDSPFSASHDEGSIIRAGFAGIFPPLQFSPIDMNGREAMDGRQIRSLHIVALGYGASGTVENMRCLVGTSAHDGRLLINESFSPGHGPMSAPIEVPLSSRLCSQVDDDEEEEEDAGINITKRVPPHELLDKQSERSRMSAFSVIEGAGRTLKGRDASKVRDAVWKQTGFSG